MDRQLRALISDKEQLALRDIWEKDQKRLMYHIKRGKDGYNKGLDNGGQKRLNQYIYGTHWGRYYLIGADSGVGKTTLADYMYFYSLYKDAKKKGITLDLDYYSFEIPEVMKKARMASLIYFLTYGQEMPSGYLMGQVEGKSITDDEQEKLFQVSMEVEEMFDSINFIESPRTPQQLWTRLVARAEQYGTIIRDKSSTGQLTEIKGYKPKGESNEVMKVTIIDHLALLEPSGNQTLKQTMDLASIFLVRARNLFNDTAVVVQQFNSEMQGAARESKNIQAYVPQRLDFGDSKYTFRDADVVMGLTKPYEFQLNKYGAYTELEKWGNYFVVNFLMKNRYGPVGPGIPYFFDPIAGIPEELPPASNWNLLLQQQYIERAAKLNKYAD